MEKLTGWRGFLAVWAGQSVSLVGSGMYAFAVGVFVSRRRNWLNLFSGALACSVPPF